MTQKSDTLTAKQKKVIECLLTSKDKTEACKRAGIQRKTLYRYLEQPKFIQAYRQAQKEGLEQGIGRLQVATNEAVNVLMDLLNDQKVSPTTKAKISKIILEMAFKGHELLELQRIQEDLDELKNEVYKRNEKQ